MSESGVPNFDYHGSVRPATGVLTVEDPPADVPAPDMIHQTVRPPKHVTSFFVLAKFERI
jgi:hypothetical protein